MVIFDSIAFDSARREALDGAADAETLRLAAPGTAEATAGAVGDCETDEVPPACLAGDDESSEGRVLSWTWAVVGLRLFCRLGSLGLSLAAARPCSVLLGVGRASASRDVTRAISLGTGLLSLNLSPQLLRSASLESFSFFASAAFFFSSLSRSCVTNCRNSPTASCCCCCCSFFEVGCVGVAAVVTTAGSVSLSSPLALAVRAPGSAPLLPALGAAADEEVVADAAAAAAARLAAGGT